MTRKHNGSKANKTRLFKPRRRKGMALSVIREQELVREIKLAS